MAIFFLPFFSLTDPTHTHTPHTITSTYTTGLLIMLANLQKTLLDHTAVIATDAVPPIPDMTPDEKSDWLQALTESIDSACRQGESSLTLEFFSRSCPDDYWWPRNHSSPIHPPPIDGQPNEVSTRRHVPMPLRRWWFAVKLHTLNVEAEKLARKRRDHLVMAYLAHLGEGSLPKAPAVHA